VLIEHPAVAEAAVVPSPDALRLAVPKAFLVLAVGAQPDAATARSILEHVRARLALQTHPPPRVRSAAENHLREDSPRRAAQARGSARRRRRAAAAGVLGRRPEAEGGPVS
jgi:acetyl-CoA synthetase